MVTGLLALQFVWAAWGAVGAARVVLETLIVPLVAEFVNVAAATDAPPRTSAAATPSTRSLGGRTPPPGHVPELRQDEERDQPRCDEHRRHVEPGAPESVDHVPAVGDDEREAPRRPTFEPGRPRVAPVARVALRLDDGVRAAAEDPDDPVGLDLVRPHRHPVGDDLADADGAHRFRPDDDQIARREGRPHAAA